MLPETGRCNRRRGAGQGAGPLPQPGFGFPANARFGGVHQADQLHSALQVVEHDDLLRDHQHRVWRAERVGRRAVPQAFLDIADAVVAEVADQAAVEAGEFRVWRHPVAGLEFLDEGQRVFHLHVFFRIAVGGDGDPVTRHRQHGAAGQPDDRVTAPPLAALGGFQQVGVGPPGDLQVDGQGGVEVGERFEYNGNPVVSLGGQPGKVIVCVHGFISCGVRWPRDSTLMGERERRGACRPCHRGRRGFSSRSPTPPCDLPHVHGERCFRLPNRLLLVRGIGCVCAAPGGHSDLWCRKRGAA